MTARELLREGTNRFCNAGMENAAFEARELLKAALDVDETAFLLRQNEPLTDAQKQQAVLLLNRRLNGEPLQYILGAWPFLDLTFRVGPGVLIPRPETEQLVLEAEKRLRQRERPVVFDLCAGSGCIGLSLLHRLPGAQIYLFEQSPDALRYLGENCKLLGFTDKCTVKQGDVLRGPAAFGRLPKADLIISNPPYIPHDELPHLQREVQREPAMALDGGEDGLTFYRCFARDWTAALREDGAFAFECGENQAGLIAEMLRPQHLVRVARDFRGVERFIFAQRAERTTYDF